MEKKLGGVLEIHTGIAFKFETGMDYGHRVHYRIIDS